VADATAAGAAGVAGAAGAAGVAGAGAGPYDGLSFEELVAALEELTERMASGDIGIEEAAAMYEQGGALHAAATARLAAVRERIDRLRAAGDDA
jgi:exodeoxyribonuclease VII small subunit